MIPEREIWLLDQEINRRGLPCDLEQAEAAVELMTEGLQWAQAEIARLTDGEITTVNQNAKIAKFCGLPSCKKHVVAQALEHATGVRRKVLELRRDFGKSSVAKYQSMLDRAGHEALVKGSMIYHGASTGRWTGEGFQALNLFKSYFPHRDIVDLAIPMIKRRDADMLRTFFGNVPPALASALRAGIRAPDGYELICADYSGIEAIGSAWLVNDEEDLRLFTEGKDPYIPLAAMIYRKPESQVTGKERGLGKVTRLGAQYGMGQSKKLPTFQNTCKNQFRIEISHEFAQEVIYDVFRPRYDNLVKYWKQLDRAAVRALKVPRAVRAGKVKWWYNREDDFLHCKLPNGRCLSYCQPRLGEGKFGGECVTFMSMVQLADKNGKKKAKKWLRRDGYGGLWLENIDQGMCRDFMVEGMFRTEAAGYKTILTVYDEVIAIVPEGFGSLEEFCALLGQPIDWAPGCPIRATGWRGKHYRKD